MSPVGKVTTPFTIWRYPVSAVGEVVMVFVNPPLVATNGVLPTRTAMLNVDSPPVAE